MKKRWIQMVATATALTLMLGIGAACSPKEDSDAVSYMAVDINPSVSFVLDRDDRVLSVIADNEDAQVMLYGEELVGKKAEDALETLASLSVELGYLNEFNTGVGVWVAGKADEEELVTAAQAAFAAQAGDLAVNVSSEGTFSLNRQLRAVKAEYAGEASVQDMDLIKFRLVVEAQEADHSLTVTAAAEMDADELIAIIEQGAQKVLPYATKAYQTAVSAANRIYKETKGQLLDSIWTIPYTKDLVNIVTGDRKYDVNYGLIYNVYTGSSRVMAAGIDAAEAAAEAAQQIGIQASMLEAIEQALPQEAREEFRAKVDADSDGTVTLAELDDYFDRYFKNMTAQEREAAQAYMEQVMAGVQNFAQEVDASIAQEYKDALAKFCEDLEALIPDTIVDTANAYVDEFKGLVTDLRNAVEGKEPMAAAYAAKEALDARAEDIMETMRKDLTQEDLEDVESRIAAVEQTLASAEERFREAVAEAENAAKEFLETMKENRREAA